MQKNLFCFLIVALLIVPLFLVGTALAQTDNQASDIPSQLLSSLPQTNTAAQTPDISSLTPAQIKDLANLNSAKTKKVKDKKDHSKEDANLNAALKKYKVPQSVQDQLDAINNANLGWTANYNSIMALTDAQQKKLFGVKLDQKIKDKLSKLKGGQAKSLPNQESFFRNITSKIVAFFTAPVKLVAALWNSTTSKFFLAQLSPVPNTPYVDNFGDTKLPDSFDWSGGVWSGTPTGPNYITPVKNQGICGDCWAFAAVGALEGKINAYYNDSNQAINPDLSEQDLTSCAIPYGSPDSLPCTTNNDCYTPQGQTCVNGSCTPPMSDGGCTGAEAYQIEGLFSNYLPNTGVAQESDFPFAQWDASCDYKNPNWQTNSWKTDSSYVSVNLGNDTQANDEAIKNALINNGPVEVGIIVYNDLPSYKGGIYVPNPAAYSLGAGHTVVIVGYGFQNDTPYWIAKNSWGPGWGENGFFRIATSALYIDQWFAFAPGIPSAIAQTHTKNCTLLSAQTPQTNVWTNNYVSVWHLNDAGASTIKDSTSNKNTMQPYSTAPSATPGVIATNAAGTNGGSQGLYVPSPKNQPTGNSKVTVSAWVKFNSFVSGPGGNVVAMLGADSPSATGFGLWATASGAGFGGPSNQGVANGSTGISTGKWYYLTGVYDGSQTKVYLNGNIDGSTSYSSFNVTNKSMYIGHWDGYSSLGVNGAIDEVRVSNTARSPGWINTEYQNQSSPNTFYSVGSQQTSGQNWLTGAGYRQQITINHSKVGIGLEDETNFPTEVVLTGLTKAQSDGSDIQFTTSDGTTVIPSENESFSNGNLTAWVNVPTLSHTGDTQIYVYYGGNTNPSGTQQYCYWGLGSKPATGCPSACDNDIVNGVHIEACPVPGSTQGQCGQLPVTTGKLDLSSVVAGDSVYAQQIGGDNWNLIGYTPDIFTLQNGTRNIKIVNDGFYGTNNSETIVRGYYPDIETVNIVANQTTTLNVSASSKPLPEITSPMPDDILGNTVNVIGDTGGMPITSYKIEWSPYPWKLNGAPSYIPYWSAQGITLINSGTQPVTNGILAQWDTSAAYQAGYSLYSSLRASSMQNAFRAFLRITVFYSGGSKTIGGGSVWVSNSLTQGWPQRINYLTKTCDQSWLPAGIWYYGTHSTTDVWSAYQTPVTGKCYAWTNLSPVVADLKGDNKKEVIVLQGGFPDSSPILYAYNPDGSLYWSKTLPSDAGSGAPNGQLTMPIVGNLQGDGKNKIIVFNPNINTSTKLPNNSKSILYALNGDGSILWKKYVPGDMQATMLMADLNADGKQKIVIKGNNMNPNPVMSVWDSNGNMVSSWNLPAVPFDNMMDWFAQKPTQPTWVQDPGYHGDPPSPAVGHFIAGSKKLQIVSVTTGPLGGFSWNPPQLWTWTNQTLVNIYNEDGSALSSWNNGNPVTLTGVDPTSPAVGDLKGTGTYNVVLGVSCGPSNLPSPDLGICGGIYALNSNGNVMPGWPFGQGTANFGIGRQSTWTTPAIGDVNGDGKLEIAVAVNHYGLGLGGDDFAYLFNYDGSVAPGNWPIRIGGAPFTGWQSVSATTGGHFIIGGVTDDGKPNIVISENNGFTGIHEFYQDGTEAGQPQNPPLMLQPSFTPETYAKPYVAGAYTGYSLNPPAAIADLNNDGNTEIIAASNDDNKDAINYGPYSDYSWQNRGSIYVWNTDQPYDASTMQWPMYMHDTMHTGCYDCTPATVTPPPTLSSIWAKSYAGVWHLNDAGASTIKDSTSNKNTMKSYSSAPGATQGVVANAASTDGATQGLYVPSPKNQPTGNSKVTVSAWVKFNSFVSGPGGNVVAMLGSDSGGATGFGLWATASGAGFGGPSNQGVANGSTGISTGKWYYLTGVYDGSNTKIYLNGNQDGVTSYSSFNVTNKSMYIGHWDGYSSLGVNGSIDEVRVSNVARSPGWINTEYQNQNSPTNFYSVGGQQTSTNGSDWLAGAGYRQQITINHSKVGIGLEDETNFPTEVVLTGLTKAQSDGSDIQFTTSDGTTVIPSENESFSNGNLTAWVNVPTLSHNSDTQIYVYYGTYTSPISTGPGGAGNSCSSNSDCVSQLCLPNKTCATVGSVNSYCSSDPNVPIHCGAGLTCSNNVCVVSGGGPGNNPVGSLSANVGKSCTPATELATCGGVYSCGTLTNNNICGGAQAQCTTDDQCTYKCINNSCAAQILTPPPGPGPGPGNNIIEADKTYMAGLPDAATKFWASNMGKQICASGGFQTIITELTPTGTLPGPSTTQCAGPGRYPTACGATGYIVMANTNTTDSSGKTVYVCADSSGNPPSTTITTPDSILFTCSCATGTPPVSFNYFQQSIASISAVIRELVQQVVKSIWR